MRIFQRTLSAAFNAWAAEHRAIKTARYTHGSVRMSAAAILHIEAFHKWHFQVNLLAQQRKVMKKVAATMSHGKHAQRSHSGCFSRLSESGPSKLVDKFSGDEIAACGPCVSSWLAWLRSMHKAISQTRAVLMRIFQRTLALLSMRAAEHRAIKRRATLMAVCVCRLQRFSTSRAFQRWCNSGKRCNDHDAFLSTWYIGFGPWLVLGVFGAHLRPNVVSQ